MPSTFSDFTLGTIAGGATPIQTDDFVVGYDTSVLNGERRWAITTLAQSVSSVMSQEITNKISQQAITESSPAAAKAWVNFTVNSSNVIVQNNSFNIVGISTPSLNRFTVTVNFNIEDDKPILMTGGLGGTFPYPTYGTITSRSSDTVNFRVDTGAGGGGSYGTTLAEFNVVFF
jgi:hypothetical protein